ncbi:MAG: two-component regulator propeller domain-containing protein [Gammaproteobacteria bacterium]
MMDLKRTPVLARRILTQMTTALVLAFSTSLALAEVGNPMRFGHLGMGEGLSQSTVNVMHQDQTGFLWFGTENGLNRYDGNRVHQYKRDPNNPNSLGADFIWDMTEDANGNLWIATNGGGVARWNSTTNDFTSYRHNPEDESSISMDGVRTITYTTDGSVWLGTMGAGLDRLNPATGKSEHYRHDETNDNSLANDEVYEVMQDSRGIIWVTTNNGLSRFDPITRAFENFRYEAGNPNSLSSNKVRAIGEDKQGMLWFGTRSSGLNRFDRESGVFTRFQHDANDNQTLSHNGVRSIFEDDAGRLWVGTNTGLNLFDRQRNRFLHYKHDRSDPGSLSDSYIMSLYQDRSGILWVGTRSKGASKWNPRSWGFGHFSPDRLSDGNVTSFAEDRSKTLWVGTFGSGLNKINRSSGDVSFITKDSAEAPVISDNHIMSMVITARNELWLGTMVAGIDRVNLDTGEVTNFRHDPNDESTISSNGIMALFEDREGNIWIGTFGGGVNRMSTDGSVMRFPFNQSPSEGVSSARATAFEQDRSGRIWIGTDGGGLSIYDEVSGYFHTYRHNQKDPDSISADTIYDIHRDMNGVMWVGTQGGGLTRAVGDVNQPGAYKFKRFIPSSGPTINNVVYGIESDTDGDLWLSTNYGISQYATSASKVSNFHRSHGLQSEEFNFGAHYRSPTGQLFFGGANGFNAFYPSDLGINTVPPEVVLTRVSLLNKPIDIGKPHWLADELSLSHRDDVLSIEFSALDFAAPTQNRFAYKLEGFDPEWIEAGNKRHVTYTNLDAGDYRFLVRASNSDGVWQTDEMALNLTTAPAPWNSRTAYFLYFLLAIGAAWLAWSIHQKQLRQEAGYRRRLEKDVQERTRELAARNGELKQLNQRFLQASITDPLTGLRNRRYVFEEIAKDIDVVRRRYESGGAALPIDLNNPNQSDFIFMMIDLDNFKPVNDTCGHSAGDEMLMQIRDLLLACCRSSDAVIRWGGDEFLVIGRYSDLRQGEVLAERIRSRMENAIFSVGNGQATRTTASIGITGFPFVRSKPDLMDWEQLLSLADSAMYRAKATRNAWVSIVSTEQSSSVINPFYSFRDHTDAMVEQGMLEVRSSHDTDIDLALEG